MSSIWNGLSAYLVRGKYLRPIEILSFQEDNLSFIVQEVGRKRTPAFQVSHDSVVEIEHEAAD